MRAKEREHERGKGRENGEERKGEMGLFPLKKKKKGKVAVVRELGEGKR